MNIFYKETWYLTEDCLKNPPYKGANMLFRVDPKTYADNWENESNLFEAKGIYKHLNELTPDGKVLEIGAGTGLSTLELAKSHEVLAIDNNPYLLQKSGARLANANSTAKVLSANIFEPSDECLSAIRDFSPNVIVGWFLGSHAYDQEKYAGTESTPEEMAKKYRENIEDAMLTGGICPPSVEWIHLAARSGLIQGVSEDFIFQETKKDYDEYVFLDKGFEVTSVKILDWDVSDSSFQYGVANNPNILPGQPVPKIVSILAKRTRL